MTKFVDRDIPRPSKCINQMDPVDIEKVHCDKVRGSSQTPWVLTKSLIDCDTKSVNSPRLQFVTKSMNGDKLARRGKCIQRIVRKSPYCGKVRGSRQSPCIVIKTLAYDKLRG